MMGNENSQLSGLEIEEKPVETTDFWRHYQAKINDSCRYFSLKSDGSVSVFKGEAAAGPLWSVSTPLEKFSNNLLKYRHPCIVRYISAWQQRSTLHLATEYLQPMAQVLSSLTPLQICIGLNNVLRALVFLHEQVFATSLLSSPLATKTVVTWLKLRSKKSKKSCDPGNIKLKDKVTKLPTLV